jgi:hypothetical protein
MSLHRLIERLHRFPLARFGGVLVILGTVVEALDAFGQIDISPVAQALGFDPALVVSLIGVTKISLRCILAASAALAAAKASQ